jgi:hypothetical protein
MPLGRKHFRRSRDAPMKAAGRVDWTTLLDALVSLADSGDGRLNTEVTEVTEVRIR